MMFAEVSRHQHPHHFTSPLHSPRRYTFHPSSDTFLHDLQQASNIGSPRSNAGGGRAFQEHPQYVLPQQEPQPQAAMQTPRPVSLPVRMDSSEHMLRRKTPNGTLSAAYDGAPVEWASRPHANKHILLSGSETMGHRTPQVVNMNSPPVPVALSRPAAIRSDSGSAHLWNRAIASPVFRSGYVTNTEDAAIKQQRIQNDYYTASLDSMLHQAPINQQVFFGPSGYQQIPTVLQPLWPPSIGPTASNAQGRFGPYWPDGSFEPYRPASIRDSRFDSQFANINLNGPQEPHAAYDSAWSRPHPSFVGSRNSEFPTQLLRRNDYHGDASILPQEQILSQRHISDPTPLRQMHDVDSATSYVPQGRTTQMKYPALRGDNFPWPSPPASAQYVPLSTAGKLVSPSGQQFKTKVLLWAHRIYLNLVHQSRRQNHLKHSSENGHSQSTIYPNPSRHTSTDLRDLIHGHNLQFFNRTNSTGAGASVGRRLGNEVEQDGSAQDLRWPHNNSRSTFHERHDRGLRLTEAPQTITQGSFSGHQQLSSIFPGPFPTPAFSPQHIQSPAIEAKAAMNMLDTLCQESGWQWVDGILLGGCLAYGLEQFSLALRWYERVLACDSNNVEALSNMAAAHLSLKDTKEAERHWFRAVKLRPSYFEAVEHLVGLLCGDQRGRDAVKVIEYVESSLKVRHDATIQTLWDQPVEQDGNVKCLKGPTTFDADRCIRDLSLSSDSLGSSGYRISATDNGRMLALIHAKGNMLYALGDNAGAAKAFEDAIMIGSGRRSEGISGLIKYILSVFTKHILSQRDDPSSQSSPCEAILLLPKVALKTADLVFPIDGQLPGLREMPDGPSKKAAVSVASNSLLSLAKIYQDGMSSSGAPAQSSRATPGVQDILALYYLSLSLQPSPSTANNVGILLASVQQSVPQKPLAGNSTPEVPPIPGVIPGSGIALALAYYNYGLNLDNRHAHLYTNLGSLLKDIGQLTAAIKMYEHAVACDGKFDIALANLANAVKDQGRTSDAIGYYERAVKSNPDFAEAVCGLANALNSVCNWNGRGGIVFAEKKYDRWHVDENGMLIDANEIGVSSSGWIAHVVAIVEKQLKDGQSWGKGFLRTKDAEGLFSLKVPVNGTAKDHKTQALVLKAVEEWAGQDWEGARVVRIIERATKRFGWQMYQEKYVQKVQSPIRYARPNLPASLVVPSAPTVLPFHTFTCPLTANQIRKISQRNGLRISCSTLRAAWLPEMVFEPPPPPKPHLNVGYVSSDFNNHPLAHLMQSVFGFHDRSRVKAFCYATTVSDNSSHRELISREAPVFRDVSSWPVNRLVEQIVDDGIHILINLNGYTRGARNEVFAARPAPIQMSFMGFAGTLGAEWCDYLLADEIAVPPSMLRPYRNNVDLIDQTKDKNYSDDSDWVYGENIIYARDTFFCCDHRQSAPDAQEEQLTWSEEQQRRKRMRDELFPNLSDDTVILGNFNQLYKIEPTTFRTWLRILQAIPNAVLWLLRFPDLGEANLRTTAVQWASASVADRIIFTDVAPKHQHISRARVCDLFLDTPECNAHTTAADVLWSGTPLLTLPRYEYKMCSRMAASILRGALPRGEQGDLAAQDLTANNEEQYEQRAVRLGNGLAAVLKGQKSNCRLLELRRMLYEGRWSSALFDTRRWVRDLEEAYEEAWRRWVAGEGGDIWL